jgi:pimeloyl-ACP methyl ester carboxylesterase
MSARSAPQPIYLDNHAAPLLGFLQLPSGSTWRDVAVLICPPFGWDDVCSYRSRREWAAHLAASGYASLRVDLPGAGDSAGSPRDPDRLQSWIAAAESSASWLRGRTGANRVVAIGIGLGGLVLSAAWMQGAPIDDLVLWATPARGRTFVRELRAFASLEEAGLSPNRARGGALKLAKRSPEVAADGHLEVGGFFMSLETVRALETLDLTKLAAPNSAGRHVLMLERDGLPVDDRLRRHLEAAGVAVTIAPARGYGAMMAEPQDAVPPTEVFETVGAWLAGLSAPATAPPEKIDGASLVEDGQVAELETDGIAVRESPFTVHLPWGGLFGILSEPLAVSPAGICVVLLSAGAIHRIGPNRMWVEVARRWAGKGVPVLRLDFAALGDADGDSAISRDPAARYAPETIDQIRATLDALEARGVASRFILSGLCSGAYWSFRGALEDERVTSAFMLNAAALVWDPNLENMRNLRASMRDARLWRRAVQGKVSRVRLLALLTLMRGIRTYKRTHRRAGDELELALDSLHESGKPLMLAFSEREPLHEELARDGRLARLDGWPNLTLESLPGVHHSLREIQSQQAAHEVLDRTIARELNRLAPEGHRRPTSARPASDSLEKAT